MEKNNLKNFFENLSLKKFGLNKLVLIVLVGILLIIISLPAKEIDNNSNNLNQNDIQIDKEEYDVYAKYIEDKLKAILEESYGEGTIEVMVTVKETQGGTTNSYFSDVEQSEVAYVDGVLIIAKVGNNQNAIAEITNGVSALFNLPVHKVAVIKK